MATQGALLAIRAHLQWVLGRGDEGAPLALNPYRLAVVAR